MIPDHIHQHEFITKAAKVYTWEPGVFVMLSFARLFFVPRQNIYDRFPDRDHAEDLLKKIDENWPELIPLISPDDPTGSTYAVPADLLKKNITESN